MENYNRIKDGNGKLVLGEDEVQRIWKDYFEDLYNVDTQEQGTVHMCGFDGVQRSNYFRGEMIKRTEVGVRMRKLKNGGAAVKGEVIYIYLLFIKQNLLPPLWGQHDSCHEMSCSKREAKF